MQHIPVESSNLASVAFDPRTCRLEVAFKDKNGAPTSLYVYYDVAEADFNGLLAAPSKGKYFAERIKPKYQAEKLERLAESGSALERLAESGSALDREGGKP